MDHPGHARPGLPSITAATEHASPPPDDQIPLTRNEIAALFSTLIIEPVDRHPAPAAMVRLAAAPPAPRQNLPLPAASPPTMKITKSGWSISRSVAHKVALGTDRRIVKGDTAAGRAGSVHWRPRGMTHQVQARRNC